MSWFRSGPESAEGFGLPEPRVLSGSYLCLYSSKVSRDTLYEAVREVLHGNQRKRRK